MGYQKIVDRVQNPFISPFIAAAAKGKNPELCLVYDLLFDFDADYFDGGHPLKSKSTFQDLFRASFCFKNFKKIIGTPVERTPVDRRAHCFSQIFQTWEVYQT